MISRSKSQTQKLAAKIAKEILNAKRSTLNAKVIALQGELGAGKTTFVQGFMKALGIKRHITSPTFIIYRKYPVKCQVSGVSSDASGRSPDLKKRRGCQVSNVYHFDLYRIHKPKEILDLGFKKIISNSDNIVLIEWPEKIKRTLPRRTTWIKFGHGRNEKERIIKIKSSN